MSHEDTTDRDSMQDFNLGLGLGGGLSSLTTLCSTCKWTWRACLEALAGKGSSSNVLDQRTSSIREGGPPPPSAQLWEGHTQDCEEGDTVTPRSMG